MAKISTISAMSILLISCVCAPVRGQTTLYSDVWSDSVNEATEGALDLNAYGVGVTSDDYYQYDQVKADNRFFGVNGELLEEDVEIDYYYAEAGFAHHWISDVPPGNDCSSTKHEWYDPEAAHRFSLGLTWSPISWSSAHVRWRNLGQVGDGHWDYGPDDCVTDCIRGHIYETINRGTYAHGDGSAVYFFETIFCHIRISFSQIRGQCSGPSF